MAAMTIGERDLMGDEVWRVRVGRDRIDLQLDALDALHLQPVDIERAGMAVLARRIERGLDLAELGDQRCSAAGFWSLMTKRSVSWPPPPGPAPGRN